MVSILYDSGDSYTSNCNINIKKIDVSLRSIRAGLVRTLRNLVSQGSIMMCFMHIFLGNINHVRTLRKVFMVGINRIVIVLNHKLGEIFMKSL